MRTQKYSIKRTLLESLHATVKASDYPDGVMEDRSGRIQGPGFFPGSTGIVVGTKVLASRRIMVLGQDQDNQKGHDKSEAKGDELYSKTWTNMTDLFGQAQIDIEDCFFTNFIMGVRVNSKRNTGPSPALAHPAFMVACSAFFIQQLVMQRPKVILCLGMIPFKLLSLVSTGLRLRSIGIDTFKELDARGMNVIQDVRFDSLPEERFLLVPLCHPSYPQNSRLRFRENRGAYSSEVELLKEVREKYLK